MAIPSFDHNQLRALSEVIADVTTHSEIGRLFRALAIEDSEGSKVERLSRALDRRQARDGCGNTVGALVQEVCSPVRFVSKQAEFTELRHRLNEILAFGELQLDESGKLEKVDRAHTISQARERAGRLRKALSDRAVHADVLTFCREELLHENYFHAVFEATKSLAEKIRTKSELQLDGSELVDRAFGVKRPLLAINSLRSETEVSEQIGLSNMIKGVFGLFRNVTAHAPKVNWPIEEQDALDLLTIVSYLHRRIDECVAVPNLS